MLFISTEENWTENRVLEIDFNGQAIVSGSMVRDNYSFNKHGKETLVRFLIERVRSRTYTTVANACIRLTFIRMDERLISILIEL